MDRATHLERINIKLLYVTPLIWRLPSQTQTLDDISSKEGEEGKDFLLFFLRLTPQLLNVVFLRSFMG